LDLIHSLKVHHLQITIPSIKSHKNITILTTPSLKSTFDSLNNIISSEAKNALLIEQSR
tara:strand:+ start:1281 stop:1457 length:177 start_codon:yes stop_codon:yes gene_type:complete